MRAKARVIEDGADGLRDSIRVMLGNLQIYLPFYLALALFGVGISVVFYWGPVLMTRVFDYPVDQVSKMLGLGHIAWAVAGAVAAGVLTDFVARRKGPVGLIGVAGVISLLGIPTSLAVFTGNGTAAVALLSGVTFASAIFRVRHAVRCCGNFSAKNERAGHRAVCVLHDIDRRIKRTRARRLRYGADLRG